ncbi:hypothetical protein JCM5353_005647 [Sporobolomyces roseus]
MDNSTSNPNPSSSLPPPLRSRSLLDLPTELIGVIVKMCADQDEAFRHRAELIKSHYALQSYAERVLDDQEDDGFGRSLGMISRSCHRMRSLSAPHIFKTLKASRTNMEYRCYIAPQHHCHFQHAILDATKHEEAINLVTSLASLPNLHELTLDADAANAVYGADIFCRAPSLDRPLMNMLIRKGRDVRTLHLRNFDFSLDRPLHYIAKFPNLQSLSLVGSLQTTSTVAVRLAKSISQLVDLKLDLGETARFPSEFLEVDCKWPKLKKLSINSNGLEDATLDFISIFAPSLRQLSVTTPHDDHVVIGTDGLVGGSLFPLLDTISVVGSSLVAWRIFGDSTKSTFPSLVKVRLSYIDGSERGFGSEDEVLKKVFDTSTIHFLQYDPPDQDIPLEHKDYLRGKANEMRFRLQLYDCPEEAFPTTQVLYEPAVCIRQARKGLSYCNREPLREQVERVRNHLDDSIALAELTGNPVEYQRILNLARPLEFDRLAKLD